MFVPPDSKAREEDGERDYSAEPCPLDKANICSKLTFWWVAPLLRRGSTRRLNEKDLYGISSDDEVQAVRL